MTVKQWVDSHSVKIGSKVFIVDGAGKLGGDCRLKSAVVDMLDGELWKLHRITREGNLFIKPEQQYQYNLLERVSRRIKEQLDEVTRTMNKKLHRRYVHWSNHEGRYFDEGE